MLIKISYKVAVILYANNFFSKNERDNYYNQYGKMKYINENVVGLDPNINLLLIAQK